MIVDLLLVLAIISLLFYFMVYNHIYKCPKQKIYIKYIRASRLPSDPSEGFGKVIDNIKLRLDRDVPCGIYYFKSIYDNGVIYISKLDKQIGYMVVKNFEPLGKTNMFDLWDLERIDNDDPLVKTYNSGCC